MGLFGKKAKKSGKTKNKANSPNRRRKIIWVFILLAVPFGILLKESLEWYSIQERLASQKKENERIQQQIAKMDQEKDKLKKADPETIEKQAREKLNFTRPGEVVYVPSTTQ